MLFNNDFRHIYLSHDDKKRLNLTFESNFFFSVSSSTLLWISTQAIYYDKFLRILDGLIRSLSLYIVWAGGEKCCIKEWFKPSFINKLGLKLLDTFHRTFSTRFTPYKFSIWQHYGLGFSDFGFRQSSTVYEAVLTLPPLLLSSESWFQRNFFK